MKFVEFKYLGYIYQYDPDRMIGIIELVPSGKRVSFFGMTFYSGQVTRNPRINEVVIVSVRKDISWLIKKDINHLSIQDIQGVWALN